MLVMDGDDFAREVRTHSPCRHVRLVALTAIRDPIAYTRTWSAGYDAHLEKPLTLESWKTSPPGSCLGAAWP